MILLVLSVVLNNILVLFLKFGLTSLKVCGGSELNFFVCLSVALQDTCWWRTPQAGTAFTQHALRDLAIMARASRNLQANSDATAPMATPAATVRSRWRFSPRILG